MASKFRPLIVHHHHFDGIWQEAVDLAVLRRADVVTTDSEWGRDVLRFMNVTCPIEIIPAGTHLRPTIGFRKRRTLLFVGALKPRKNPLILPDILVTLRRQSLHADLQVVGDGPLWQPLRQRARIRGVADWLTMYGHIPDDMLASFHSLASVFVFPTRLEGFGMPVLDAMACGTPVVATRVGAIPELVEDGVTGYLVDDPDDAEAFADRIAELLKHPALMMEMGQAAQARARAYSWDAAAVKLASLCQSLA